MAANNQIVKKSIQIDAGDTLRTVKSLKQEISDLRDELLNLEKGTEEYDEVQKKLHDDVEDLNEVMGAHKDKAEALEGSYNALQNELKELKKAWKETNDEAERDVLGQKINEVNNQLKEMDASIGDFHRNVGNYESAWNGLTGVMDKGEKITDDLEKGFKAFGTALGMSDKQVNSISNGLKKLKDAFKIAKDIAKAREETTKLGTAEAQAAAQGTALATSQKATGAAAKTMAVSEGTATVATKGLSVAMRGLKTALISTGIGALIVALGSLIGLLDKAASKAKSARTAAKYGDVLAIEDQRVKNYQDELKNLERQEELIDKESRMKEAQGKTEQEILEYQKEQNKELEKQARLKAATAEADYKAAQAVYDAMTKSEQESETGEKQKEHVDNLKAAWEALQNKVEDYAHEQNKLQDDIDVFLEKQKYATKEVTNELVKWSDLIKNPQFQASWHALWQIDFSEVGSPVDVLKVQREAAKNLIQMYSGDTKEVEQFFNQTIQEAEAEWQSLVDKEKQIFDERLTPAQRLENEKVMWVELANKWGMDATTIVKYYDKKIQEELDRVRNEEKAKQETAQKEAENKLSDFMSNVESTLGTEEKLQELFTPMFTGKTVTDEIKYDMENLQTLYDAQMNYLNGLLETADLTEEEYAAVEDRITSLTVAFNKQMGALQSELNVQGENVKIFGKDIRGLSKKWIANMNLMEQATADFSSTFQALGLEDSAAFKGFATAQALISAILAANRVLAEEPGGAVFKGIAAAATLAAGLANVAAIWMVNPDGSNAGSSMNTSMSQPAVPVIGNAQPINYVSNVSNAAEEDELNKYNIVVKVSDIEEGLEGQRVRVQNSSF